MAPVNQMEGLPAPTPEMLAAVQNATTPKEIAEILTLSPHMKAMRLTFHSAENEEVALRLPYDDRLIGYPDTGIIAGGAIYTLMDSTAGLSVMSRIGRLMPAATLDLRIDYLRPATPKRDVIGYATCYRLTREIAFVRGRAAHENSDQVIAHVAGTFALGPTQTSQPESR
ncbi:MAG: PaaI family thioesterase [Pseudomonadota bacterium]